MKRLLQHLRYWIAQLERSGEDSSNHRFLDEVDLSKPEYTVMLVEPSTMPRLFYPRADSMKEAQDIAITFAKAGGDKRPLTAYIWEGRHEPVHSWIDFPLL